MARLKLFDWIGYAPDKPGKIRVNHNSDECGGTRKSMIVERKSNGSANAYCFRCGRSGYYSPPRFYRPPSGSVGPDNGCVEVVDRSRNEPPTDAHPNWHAFPREVREWLIKGGVTSVINSAQGILWSDTSERLWIPIKKKGDLVGWVERRFSPKYVLTRTDNREECYGYYLTHNVINNGKLMLVEDVLSAIKCSNLIDTISLLGTYVKPKVISDIAKAGYKDVYIFLDADNPVVRMKARGIAKKLPFVACHVIETGRDPKHHTIQEIEELIK